MKTETKDGILTISLKGNLLGETSNAPVMELLTKNLAEGNKKVLFNLAEMQFINSTGLGMLLTAVSKTRNAGGELVLCCLPDQMKKLLQITKLESVFHTQPDEAAATAFLKSV
jgi:anti-sigma B factor antagonist